MPLEVCEDAVTALRMEFVDAALEVRVVVHGTLCETEAMRDGRVEAASRSTRTGTGSGVEAATAGCLRRPAPQGGVRANGRDEEPVLDDGEAEERGERAWVATVA